MRREGSLFAMVFTVLVCTMWACALDSSDADFLDVQDHGELPSPRPLPAAASVAAAAAAGQAAAARVARAARAAHAANAAWYCTPEQAAAAAAGSGGGGTFVDLEPQDAARGRAQGMFEEDAPGYLGNSDDEEFAVPAGGGGVRGRTADRSAYAPRFRAP